MSARLPSGRAARAAFPRAVRPRTAQAPCRERAMRRSTVPPGAAAAEQRVRTRRGSGVNRLQRCRSTTPHPMDCGPGAGFGSGAGRHRTRTRPARRRPALEVPSSEGVVVATRLQALRATPSHPDVPRRSLMKGWIMPSRQDRSTHSRPPRRAGHDPVLRSNNPLAVETTGQWPRRSARGAGPRGRYGASTPRSCG